MDVIITIYDVKRTTSKQLEKALQKAAKNIHSYFSKDVVCCGASEDIVSNGKIIGHYSAYTG